MLFVLMTLTAEYCESHFEGIFDSRDLAINKGKERCRLFDVQRSSKNISKGQFFVYEMAMNSTDKRLVVIGDANSAASQP